MVWVAADCDFESNQEEKVQNWNETVEEEDEVLILGHFFNGNPKDLLQRLKGKKIIIDYENLDYKGLTKQDLIDRGFSRISHTYSFSQNGDSIVHILPDDEKLKMAKQSQIACASARSITKQKEVLDKNILSLSFEDWGNTPIDYSKIPLLYQNIKNFYTAGDGSSVS